MPYFLIKLNSSLLRFKDHLITTLVHKLKLQSPCKSFLERIWRHKTSRQHLYLQEEVFRCFNKISTFVAKEVKRSQEGGLSLSTKSRHLPLRKQFHYESPGKPTSSLNETALFLWYFDSSNTIQFSNGF